jgi:hypothetical protein
MNMNDSQIHLAYNMMNYKKADFVSVKNHLDLALKNIHSSIVFSHFWRFENK